MQSNNPILTRVETYTDITEPMTIQGAIQKSVLLTAIAAVLGMALFSIVQSLLIFQLPMLQQLLELLGA